MSLLSCCSATAFGQTNPTAEPTSTEAKAEPSAATAKPPTKDAASSENPLERLPPEVIYLPLKNKELVPVKPGASVEGYYKFLQQSRDKPEERIPPEVAKLTLTGVADDTRAVLQAKFVIRNRGGEEFVRLPLAMHEAIIRKELSTKGPGILQPARPDRTQGHVWLLRGQGDHELNLEISVPVKKLGADRRLQLTLPTATQTQLQLTTGFPAVVVKDSEGDIEVINAQEPTDPPARIVKYGLGQRLDLTWQPIVAESPLPAQLEADTVILAYANQDRLFIEAFQQIDVVQGSISELAVRLPSEADLISVDSARDYRSHRRAPEDPSRVIVQLNGPKTGKFELHWTVRLKPTELGRFVIEGFQVEQARKQIGKIGLSPVEGLRMTVANADHPHLHQISTAEFRTLAPQVTRAYKFYSQPFRLVVGVENVEPYFTVQPRIALGVTLDELTLEAEFSLHVLRGNLKAVVLDWPNWKSDEWKTDELIEEASPDSPAASGRLRLRLAEDHRERVTLRFKARRSIRPESSIPLSLPRVIASDSAPTVLSVIDAPNVGSELIQIGETVLNLVDAERFLPSEKKSPASSLGKERTYRVLTGEQMFSLRVNRLEQRVSLSSSTDISLRGSRLHVVQSLDFDAQHEPLKAVRIAVPEFWREKPVEFFLEPDRKLSAAWLDEEGAGSTAQITMPEPRLGLFTILAVTEIPLTEESLAGLAGIVIPILDCPDYPAETLEVATDGENEANLVIAEPAWKPQPELSGGSRWTTDEPVSSVTVQFQPDGGGAQTFLIVGADLRAEWDRQGAAQCTASYRIAGGFSRLQLALPSEASPPIVVWDDRELRSPGEVVSESKPRYYTIRVRSGGDRTEHQLTVQYQLPASQAFGVYNQWSLAAPQLAQGRWMAEANWRIQVPKDQHLFGYSPSVTPKFSWQRTGAFFSRVSPADSAGSDARSETVPGITENAYAFSQFGEARELRFATMSAPLILFIGASVSMLIGFLLLNFTRLQHVLTLWTSAFVIAAVGLWYRPQLEVLLQPMLVGCLFPLAAVWLQNLWKRETPPVLTFDPLMDLVESRSSVSRPSFRGEEERAEPILVRAPGGSTHDFLQSEARSSLP